MDADDIFSSLPPEHLKIFFSLENPHYHGVEDIQFDQYQFNLTMTYKRDSDIVTPYGKWVEYENVHEEEVVPVSRNMAENKTKLVLLKVSNFGAPNGR